MRASWLPVLAALVASGCRPTPTPPAPSMARPSPTAALPGAPPVALEPTPISGYLPSIVLEPSAPHVSPPALPSPAPAVAPEAIAPSPELAGAPPQRADLLSRAQGAARGVTGGLAGPDVWVTSLANQGEGSLREALEAPGPAWVRFGVDGLIRLRAPIHVTGDKTLDGRGRRVELVGDGLKVDDAANVIISHLILRDGEVDGVSVYKSRLVWLDHLTLTGFDDGLIDVTTRSTGVTVSWCRLEDHGKAMLVGSQDWTPDDAAIRLTVHDTYFRGVLTRHPKLRFGYAHLFHVLIEGWVGEAIDVSHGGRVLLENSRLIPGPKSIKVFGLQVDPRDPPGFARAVGVDAEGMALEDSPMVEAPPYPYDASPWSAAVEQAVRERAGWQP